MKQAVVRIGGVAALLVTVAACRCGPEGVVRSYRNEDTVEGRLKYVLRPDEVRPLMQEHYRNGIRTGFEEIKSAVALPRIQPGEWSWVRVVDDRRKNPFGVDIEHDTDFLLQKTPDGYRIDWEASAGYSEMTPAAFQAQRPATPKRFRLLAKLSDYYNFEFAGAQSSHYSIELGPPDDVVVLYGYVARNHPRAEALFDLLKDGEQHPVTVKLRYLPYSQSATTALITDIESLSWIVPQ